ncbi:MAG: hypothetical protein ACRDSZ_19770 [Pseudonocardiaceae bacterium]
MSVPATGPADLDLCPYCGGATGVQLITDTLPKAQGWSCGECGTEWVISVVNPHLRPAYLGDLGAAAVEEIGWLCATLRGCRCSS